jgi:hypothetical protein
MTPPEVTSTLLLIGIAASVPLKPTFSVPALHMDPIPVTMTVLLLEPLPISLLSEATGENSEPPLVMMRVLRLLLSVPHSVLAPAFELMTLPRLIVRAHEGPRRATKPVTNAVPPARTLTRLFGEPLPPITNDPLEESNAFVIVRKLFELVLALPSLTRLTFAVLTAPTPPMFKALLTLLPRPILREAPSVSMAPSEMLRLLEELPLPMCKLLTANNWPPLETVTLLKPPPRRS